MQNYICLLRSVNVSGANIIKMVELKAFFEGFGFQDVSTYIQSGNVIFNAEEKPSASLLEKKIQEQFHTKNVAVVLKTPEEIATVIQENPFSDQPDFNPKKLYIYYLERIPDKKYIAALSGISFENEFFHFRNDVIYVYYDTGRGRAKLSNAFFEKKLGIRATVRNWNTTNKVLLLAVKTP